MTNNSLKTQRRKLHYIVPLILVLCFGTSLFSRTVTPPRALSDEELYLRAYNADQKNLYLDAAENLYAYIQRDPEAMSDTAYANTVHAVYKANRASIDAIRVERDQLRIDVNNLLRELGRPAKKTGGLQEHDRLPTPVIKSTSTQVKTMKCDVYARIALTLGEINVKYNCGYAGNRWSSNYDIHFNWCMESTDNTTEAESSVREKLLAQCANRPNRLNVRPNE